MKQYAVKVRKIIMMGVLEETHHVDASTKEIAEEIVKDDCATFCIDIDYNIEQTETESIEVIER